MERAEASPNTLLTGDQAGASANDVRPVPPYVAVCLRVCMRGSACVCMCARVCVQGRSHRYGWSGFNRTTFSSRLRAWSPVSARMRINNGCRYNYYPFMKSLFQYAIARAAKPDHFKTGGYGPGVMYVRQQV